PRRARRPARRASARAFRDGASYRIGCDADAGRQSSVTGNEPSGRQPSLTRRRVEGGIGQVAGDVAGAAEGLPAPGVVVEQHLVGPAVGAGDEALRRQVGDEREAGLADVDDGKRRRRGAVFTVVEAGVVELAGRLAIDVVAVLVARHPHGRARSAVVDERRARHLAGAAPAVGLLFADRAFVRDGLDGGDAVGRRQRGVDRDGEALVVADVTADAAVVVVEYVVADADEAGQVERLDAHDDAGGAALLVGRERQVGQILLRPRQLHGVVEAVAILIAGGRRSRGRAGGGR